MTRLTAPLAGWLGSLDEVPDPVFSGRMMGDGFAIDPTDGLVVAPCDATVVALAPTGHSVTLRSDDGATILIHIGLDTVALGGAGFTVRTAAGARVRTGDPLIEFDLATVVRGARSLITPVLVIGEGDTIAVDSLGRLVEHGAPVGAVTGGSAMGEVADAAAIERRQIVPMAHGIHARPAARIVAAAKAFAATVRISANGRDADARSVVALMMLAAKQGDELVIAASGTDAQGAVDALAELIGGGMGETETAPPRPPMPEMAATPDASTLSGVTASPGLAIGVAHHLRAAEIEVSRDGAGVSAERAALGAALAAVRASLAAQTGLAAEVAAAHVALLDDPSLLDTAELEIAAGRSAGHAWRTATRGAANALKATGDPLLIERIADLLDLEGQVLASTGGVATDGGAPLPDRAIILAEELLPSRFMALDRTRVAGICTAAGGPTSHAAILAASAGIPMLVAAGTAIHDIAPGQTLLLDADARRLDTSPGVETLAAAEAGLARQREGRAAALAAAHEDARMADGTRIEVFANLGSTDDAAVAVAAGAEGCGLLRTEFLFLERETAPSEAEQAHDYAAIAATLGDRPLIIRTLDNGGDKPVPYLPMPAEENPALGLRGVRLSLARPDLLDTQLRAILRGVPARQCRIMVPMVIEVAELLAVRAALDRARAAVGIKEAIPLGVMIETPAAAMLAHTIAQEADFLSIGSNDLTQYALACDRGSAATASRLDALHPAVLRLIAEAAAGAAAHGRWLGVCGGVASEPAAAPILIGLGVTELSAAPALVPAVKAVVRTLTLSGCRDLAARALRSASADAVRALLRGPGDRV